MNVTVERLHRVNIVNRIIKEIASRSRKFFKNKETGVIARFDFIDNKIWFIEEWKGHMVYPYGANPDKFPHGGTLWDLVNEFRAFIMGKNNTDGTQGHGGLYYEHWGYSEDDMQAIQKVAKELGYLP